MWKMIAAPLQEIEQRARRWAKAIGAAAKVIDGRSMIGGGSLPEESLATKLVSIAGEGARLTDLARRLRVGVPPVVARVERNTLLLDPRTVQPDEDGSLLMALKAALAGS